MGYEKPSQKLTFYKAFFSPQWKFLIHTILQCLSAKSTAWNEFSSTIASAIICLATNQKFNFSKYIFKSMVKNMDSSVKFLMYPRFVQVFLDKQVGDMSTHDEIFVTPSHTKKIFGNMKRVGKGFSRAVTPLFPTMMVQSQEEMGEEPIADEAANEEDVPTQSNDPPLSRVNTLGKTTKTAQAKEIASLKKRVKKMERKRKSKTPGMKKLFKIEADRLLAKRLQAREQEELTDEEKARLFVELLEKRKKHFAALRAQEKRNKPPVQFGESSKKAEAEMAEESSSKRVGEELEQESTKKQKVDDDKEREDLQ
ncbi:hypothetical protein Tco_0128826 [Tanacetum coccineum]